MILEHAAVDDFALGIGFGGFENFELNQTIVQQNCVRRFHFL